MKGMRRRLRWEGSACCDSVVDDDDNDDDEREAIKAIMENLFLRPRHFSFFKRYEGI